MKYLIRANKVVFSGSKEMIVKYMSDFYKSDSKLWLDKHGNCTDFGNFKRIIGGMGYEIRDKLPGRCRCEGTSVSISDVKRIFTEESFSITRTADRLHIPERQVAQIIRKLKLRK